MYDSSVLDHCVPKGTEFLKWKVDDRSMVVGSMKEW